MSLAAYQDFMALDPIVPVLEAAADPLVQPVPAGAVKVLPRWSEDDGVTTWRVKYREAMTGDDLVGTIGSFDDGHQWIELELRAFTRELPLTGMNMGSLYYFKVAVETPGGWSDWSTIVGCTPPSPTLPGKCAKVYAVVKDAHTAVVRWTKPIDYAGAVNCAEIQRYKLRVLWPVPGHDLGEQDPAGVRELVIDADVDSHEVDGLKCHTDYRFQVTSENITGWGEYSDESAPLIMPPPVPPRLQQPTLRRATFHTAVIQWQHPPAGPVPLASFGFRWTMVAEGVKSKALGTNENWLENKVWELDNVSASTSQHVIEGLSPGKTYVFQVRAVNLYGKGIWSDSSIPIKALEGCEPAKIVDVTVPHIYKSFITLQWTPAEENGYSVNRHLLRYAFTEDMENAVEVEPVVARKNGADTCDLRHLSKSLYFFQVAAFNEKGMSEWSDPVSADLSVTPALADATG